MNSSGKAAVWQQATFLDTFAEERRPGDVVGSTGPEGIVRQGVDVEGVIGADNGALRISPLTHPGWGRSGVVYGPYQRENGLAFGVLLLNGHHSSQTGHLMQSLPRRLYRWARGGAGDSLATRAVQWARYGDKPAFRKQIRRWAFLNRHYATGANGAIDENLAVGWFAVDRVEEPLAQGQALVIHAAGPENGELWAHVGGKSLAKLSSLQNVPLYLVIVLRQSGAAYYVASLPKARVAAAYPDFRPLAIDTTNAQPVVYAGLFQSVLGQIGFRVDTRVHAAQVAHLESPRQSWFGTAHAADTLTRPGELFGAAEVGGRWQLSVDPAQVETRGHLPGAQPILALLNPGAPSGLLNVIVRANEPLEVTGMVFRHQNDDNYWCLQISPDRCGLWLKHDGMWQEMASAATTLAVATSDVALQISDDGCEIWVAEDGHHVLGPVIDERLADCDGVGLRTADAWSWAQNFEAHPRLVQFPELFGEEFAYVQPAVERVAADDFRNGSGDLAGRRTPLGNRQWRRDLGKGQIVLNGNQAHVVASVSAPNPGRTAYMIDWPDNTFADLEVEIVPPGTGRGEGHRGRGGLIFWQDRANYIIVSNWVDDYYGGASLSSFYHLNGFEELYDAVWTNVGSRIRWGVPYQLRVTFDGCKFTASVNEEPVLTRALADIDPHFNRLSISRVGIVANWEWGDDTGSIFRRFKANRQLMESQNER